MDERVAAFMLRHHCDAETAEVELRRRHTVLNQWRHERYTKTAFASQDAYQAHSASVKYIHKRLDDGDINMAIAEQMLKDLGYSDSRAKEVVSKWR